MEKDFTASLTATLAQSGGAAGTLDTALLLLMNTVHIAEPASFDLLLGLSDGRLPSGPALETLSQLPGLKATTRTPDHSRNGQVPARTEAEPSSRDQFPAGDGVRAAVPALPPGSYRQAP